jgi:hypothetical protein
LVQFVSSQDLSKKRRKKKKKGSRKNSSFGSELQRPCRRSFTLLQAGKVEGRCRWWSWCSR